MSNHSGSWYLKWVPFIIFCLSGLIWGAVAGARLTAVENVQCDQGKEIETIKLDVTSLKEDRASLKSDVKWLVVSVSELQGQMKEMRNDIKTLLKRD